MSQKWVNEKQLRAFVREKASGLVFVEPARGSTFGLPDCYSVPYAIWVELKVGKWSETQSRMLVKYETPQLVQMDLFEKADNPVITLIAEKDASTSQLWWCPYHAVEEAKLVKYKHLNQFLAYAVTALQERAFGDEDE